MHTIQPGNPPGATNYVSDRSSKALANERRAIGDDYTRNFLERPFSADVMEYQAHLDLNRVEYAVGAPWIYFTLFVEGLPPEGSLALYAVEIDMDKDGRGDWLIAGEAPPELDLDNRRGARLSRYQQRYRRHTSDGKRCAGDERHWI